MNQHLAVTYLCSNYLWPNFVQKLLNTFLFHHLKSWHSMAPRLYKRCIYEFVLYAFLGGGVDECLLCMVELCSTKMLQFFWESLCLSGKVMEWENKQNRKIPGSLPSRVTRWVYEEIAQNVAQHIFSVKNDT
jgi:hypothetical protein